MSVCLTKNNFPRKKWLATFLFIFVALMMNAQNLSEELDTLKIVDTTIVQPYEETEYDDEDTTEQTFFSERTGLSADSFSFRKIPDSMIQKMKNDPDFWYADHAFIKKVPVRKSSSGRKILNVILWMIIIGGFAAFIMWYLANSNVSLFRKRDKAIGFDEEEIETDDIFSINYQKEIDKAVANGNYRFAVRMMYLRLLKNLAEKNIIRYKQERTNFDYLLQLNSTSYYHDFFRVTRNYEYSWYGHFEVDREKYDMIRNDFTNFERKIYT